MIRVSVGSLAGGGAAWDLRVCTLPARTSTVHPFLGPADPFIIRSQRSPERVPMTMSDAELERATLPVLLASWARIVDVVSRGDMSSDEFLRDVRVRHEIAKRLRGRPATAETRELLAELDGWLREATEPTSECVLGEERAKQENWSPSPQWYYWRGLRKA